MNAVARNEREQTNSEQGWGGERNEIACLLTKGI